MGLIYWLLVGLAAGTIAKMITPQKETGGWISSIIIGIIGALVGGFLAGVLGIDRIFSGLLGELILALLGSLLILWLYYKYFADKWKLRV
jgi:uncharacterized membrane protein YeaQ/YmgE (transglycosylase-associated protein family)